MAAVGASIGNTVAVVAVSRGGEVEVIANDLGHRATPIAVSYEDGVENIGMAAKDGFLRNSKNTMLRFVQLLGKSLESSKDVLGECVCKTTDKDGQTCFTPPDGPEGGIDVVELVSKIIDSMWTTAKTRAGEDQKHMVIAVPNNSTQEYKDAITAAAKAAGVDIKQFIPEPVAVAVAYKVGQENLTKDEKVIVYDLGGSKATVTVVSVSGGCYKVLGSVEDVNVGGKAVDDLLVALLIKEFKRKSKMDITNEPRAVAKLKAAASSAKHILSTRDSTTLAIESLHEGADFTFALTKGKFDSTLSKLYRKSTDSINAVLEKCGLAKTDISQVLLAGGTTIIPKIKTVLDLFFETPGIVKADIAPDEVIAVGAALEAEYLHPVLDTAQLNDTPLKTTKSLAVKTGDGSMQVVVPAGTLTPCKVEFEVGTADGQTSVALDVYELSESSDGGDNAAPALKAQLALHTATTNNAKKPVLASISILEGGSFEVQLKDQVSGTCASGVVQA
eukprot:m.209756 g.209756  ORF g.209756 m.209756 type:complete len:503 (-) comp33050_c1_seq6:2229-3737(-)